jgi:hypothetical protein
VHQGAADRQHLLLAAGEQGAVLVLAVLQDGELGENLLQPLSAHTRLADGKGAQFEVLAHAEAPQDVAALRDVYDAGAGDVMGAHGGDVTAREPDLAGLGAQQAGDGLEGGGFPAPLAPSRATIWPRRTCRSMPFSASILP